MGDNIQRKLIGKIYMVYKIPLAKAHEKCNESIIVII